ncbi:hypothetical protein DPEC_G00034250 [Dallia pectoralis]|uniref:Uncharacterized protein n=1 Tax=Dallia pectoralis TaxID=75939 RepID=A0ACC2HDS8_DALPE|nr:hypothetical protein DPEC_G00034250 [Dallia pectoralis]
MTMRARTPGNHPLSFTVKARRRYWTKDLRAPKRLYGSINGSIAVFVLKRACVYFRL